MASVKEITDAFAGKDSSFTKSTTTRTNDNFKTQVPDTQKQIEAIMELRKKEREEELRKFREEDARRKAEAESFSGKIKEFVKKVTSTTELNKPKYR